MPIGSSFRPATPRAQGLLRRRSAFGLGFYYAGARALLVSHWAIDSDAAVLLTTHTFAELSDCL
jgi:CHAT domain-containing protein